MQVTRTLARYVAGTRFGDHPQAALQPAKSAILDTVGVTLAWACHPVAESCLRLLEWMGGAPKAAVLGTGRRASPPEAAWANGTLGHALDFDDVNWTMWGHPSVTILPLPWLSAKSWVSAGRLEERVGDPPDILVHGVAIKRYPCCSEAHPAIDATLELVGRHGIEAKEVEAIEVGVNSLIPTVLSQHSPRTATEGMFSMEYCVAVAVLDRQVGLRQFADARARDPELQTLASRVRMYVRHDLADRAEAFNLATLVAVRLKNGQLLQHEVKAAKGTPGHPLGESELLQKFRACATSLLPAIAVEEAAERLLHLEGQTAIAPLMALLAGPAAPGG